jgi:hypothetical protein
MRDDSIRILPDEDKWPRRKSTRSVIRRLASDNFAQPLGEPRGAELILRSDMRFKTPEEIELPIGYLRTPTGHVARQEVQNQISRIDGGYAYWHGHQGQPVQRGRHRPLPRGPSSRARPEARRPGAFPALFMQGDMIKTALAQLERTAIEGGVLAMVGVIFLRRWRLTVQRGDVDVRPTAIAWEYFAGNSFNVFTMTASRLTGMLVDNAIVVVENILRPRKAWPRPTRPPSADAGRATLTTVTFPPLIFLTELRLISRASRSPTDRAREPCSRWSSRRDRRACRANWPTGTAWPRPLARSCGLRSRP